MSFVNEELPTVTLKLWRADALVLFNWLTDLDMQAVPHQHPSERQALTDLLSALTWHTDVEHAPVEEIEQAQADVARDMGW